MIKTMFHSVINMSVTGSVAISAVLIIRWMLRKMPKIYSYMLWGIVLFRLLCPYSLSLNTSLFNFLPPAQANEGQIEYSIPETEVKPYGFTDVDIPQTEINNSFESHNIPDENKIVITKPQPDIISMLSFVWAVTGCYFMIKNLLSLWQTKSVLADSVHLKDNIYINDKIPTAFIIGITSPKIYLPQGLTDEQQNYIILHEQTHIRRKDYIFKVISFVALCLHWFNPLVWLAFFLAEKDMEMSCDEAVIKNMNRSEKRQYSMTLLGISSGERLDNFAIAFSEGDTKERIKNVLTYIKPSYKYIALVLVVLICSVALLCFNPALPTVYSVAVGEGEYNEIVLTDGNIYSYITAENYAAVCKELKKATLTGVDTTPEGIEFNKSVIFISSDNSKTIYIDNSYSYATEIQEDNLIYYKVESSEKLSNAFDNHINDRQPAPVSAQDGSVLTTRIARVDYERQVVKNPDANLGTSEIIRSGEVGLVKETVTLEFKDGQIVSETVTDSLQLKQPVTEKVFTGILWNGTPIYGGNENITIPLVDNFLISRGFTGQYPAHNGVDIVAPTGTPIYAAADGVVNKALYTNRGYGVYIIIEHGGYQTLYGHCDKLAVKFGREVKKGDLIGYVGNTGNSTGPHLHFEVKQGNYRYDPLSSLSNILD